MPETLLFDVNETLLDMQALRPHFERLFGHGRVMAEWFGLMWFVVSHDPPRHRAHNQRSKGHSMQAFIPLPQ